ncbi:glycosyltransferase [Pseudarthrobacter sp. BRE9]|uniref:glycosyltransferase n=1 Tax=Pseudarthrobacter sp. BRE9 TaxID=2962582 RepID=UPI0028824963|nr:glycosyltransferase [Pseudarthrobacter sp. BRE9]MDT0167627.1 glycosyltransferase [Pseudarthrobacter sp. BRE9]
MIEAAFQPTVAAVVTSFNPSVDIISRVTLLQKHVRYVLVVDDGSSQDSSRILSVLEEGGITVVRQSRNSGIASALNEGIRRARILWKPDWILTMDQDSTLGDDYVENALRSVNNAAAQGMRVGLVSPESHNAKPVKTLHGNEQNEDVVQAFDPMQSGCLIPVSVLDEVGLFDESLFIDCVDTDFNLRIRAAGYSTPVGVGCDIAHSLGETRPMTILGRPLRVGGQDLQIIHHSPVRVYYITRNIWLMVVRYFSKNRIWMLRRLWMEVESNIVRFVFGPHRIKFLRAWLTGIRDAISGHSGRIRPKDAAKLK